MTRPAVHPIEMETPPMSPSPAPPEALLIVGHGTAKNEFARFVREKVPALAPRIMGVETVDHPTQGEIVALARKFFKAKDLTTPQINEST